MVRQHSLRRNSLDSVSPKCPGGFTRSGTHMACAPASFTCATPREVIGMIGAGVGDDLLLANSVLDVDRLTAVATAAESAGVIARVAVDSVETIEAAHRAGIRDVGHEVSLP